MANFWKIVNQVIRNADVLLLLLDARMIEETRNKEIEDKVKQSGKPLIYVITKSDLADKDEIERYKKYKRTEMKPLVFVSSIKHHGTTILRERILIEAKRAGFNKESNNKSKQCLVKVGILGYPNVGKSTLINALSGRKASPTSNTSGYTKSLQNVRADNRIMLIDTPGVIPYMEKDAGKHAAIGTIDYNKMKDPDIAVMGLMRDFPRKIEEHYGFKTDANKDKRYESEDYEEHIDYEETLEKIAIKKKILKKGNKPDIDKTSRMILKDWQDGKIK
ncbi:MAG: GTPase [Candidatus Woesearchaeota archaeon]